MDNSCGYTPELQMATISKPSMPDITSFLPTKEPFNPSDDTPPNSDPPVLDLRILKRLTSLGCPHDYENGKHPPTYTYSPHSSPSSKLQFKLSEVPEISSLEGGESSSNFPTHKIKPSRPFKAYPKIPLSITLIGATPDVSLMDSADAYAEFRRKMLTHIQPVRRSTNKSIRRTHSHNANITDPTYWEKRRINNEAAKRSKDARRAKEDEIAIRCSFLEQENLQLKNQIATLKESLRLNSMD